MTVKKFILGATLFALTMPTSFVMASECENCTTGVTPDNAHCKIEDGMTTGGAASLDGVKQYRQQMYAYPRSVYSNANTTILGEENNTALIGDDISNQNDNVGVLLKEGSMTGAAAVIDDTAAVDELIVSKQPCSVDPAIEVSSPTSIIMTRKFLENYIPKGSMTGAAANVTEFYPDVPDKFWAAPEINRLTDNCVLFGYPDGLFRPNKAITRAEMASAVVKGFNLQNTQLSGAGDFPDVPRNHWAYQMINQGATADIIEGHANGTFGPQQDITIAQAMTIVAKGLNCEMDHARADQILSEYRDGNSVPSWAKLSIAKAIDNGALKGGKSGGMINPNKKATRAEVALMLQNMRLAGGYDDTKIVENKVIKQFVEREEKIEIPTLELTMNDIINSKNANVGEKFAATTVNDIVIAGTTYPAGSRVDGKVVEVIRPTKDTEGALRLSFDQIKLTSGDDKMKMDLPKQVLTARVDKTQEINGFARAVEFPFTWTGALIGNAGRTISGMTLGVSNAAENLLDSVGTGTAEILTGKFRAGGRSYQNAGKALVMAPVDFARTAFSGLAGTFETSLDEVAYLVDPSGNKISQINPKQKLTIAFGQ